LLRAQSATGLPRRRHLWDASRTVDPIISRDT
jgi:hypothetical protein